MAGEAHGRRGAEGTMTEQEALQILGLGSGASADAVDFAYHNLITKVHSDLAAARNLTQARDTLMHRARFDGHGPVPRVGTVPLIPERTVEPVTPVGTVGFLGAENTYWRL